MSLELVCFLYDLAIQGMLYVIYDGNGDGLIHLVAYNLAYTSLSEISLHLNSPF